MKSQWMAEGLARLQGKTVIVTGATSGIGLETTRALVGVGAHVLLAVRDTTAGARVAKEFGGTTDVIGLNLANQKSIHEFADRVRGPIDVLVNNAGVLSRAHTKTADGYETTLAVNCLGPFSLTNLLLPRIRDQIVIVGSNAHERAVFDFADPHLRAQRWSRLKAYGRSKLAVMFWTLELDRRLRSAQSPVRTTTVHPGLVATNIFGLKTPQLNELTKRAMALVGNDAVQGAVPTLFALAEPLAPGSYVGPVGRLGVRGQPALIGRSAAASNYDMASRFWAFAESETGFGFPI